MEKAISLFISKPSTGIYNWSFPERTFLFLSQIDNASISDSEIQWSSFFLKQVLKIFKITRHERYHWKIPFNMAQRKLGSNLYPIMKLMIFEAEIYKFKYCYFWNPTLSIKMHYANLLKHVLFNCFMRGNIKIVFKKTIPDGSSHESHCL